MKKITILFSLFVLLTAFTCEDEPLEGEFINEVELSCEIATGNVVQAALAFLEANDENYTQICTAFRSALQSQIQACGDPDGSLQAQIDDLGDCTLDNQSDDCAAANSAVSVAQAAFDNATDENYTELCNAYRDALENLIVQCGNDGGTQSEIDDLGDCTMNNQSDEDIVGTWLATSWISEEPVDINNDGVESTDLLAEFECYNNETIVFNANNTGVIMSTSYADVLFEIEVGSSDTYIYSVDCILEDENTSFTWSQNGSQITIVDELDIESVWTLEGNQISTFIPQGFIAFNIDDASVTTSQDLTFIYTKQ
ncbi:lipocalin family protein [uncultured Psychroserpens sp.]|uniref:lipocalin family protein n=1 Tax=uncultured Psychroserpens sp. TaxID=255436 RepID=UPI002635E64F|nr:lipocalin family protein [uncultured Psychroserpens sp.]